SVKLLLILIFPLLGFLAFSGVYVTGKYQTLTEMNRTVTASGAAQKISAVITALQRERGASGVFIGSSGKNMGDKLAEFRRGTDLAESNLRAQRQGSIGMDETLRAIDEHNVVLTQVDVLSMSST